MPVPKNKQKQFRIIVATNVTRGKSLEAAKQIADKAVKTKKKSK